MVSNSLAEICRRAFSSRRRISLALIVGSQASRLSSSREEKQTAPEPGYCVHMGSNMGQPDISSVPGASLAGRVGQGQGRIGEGWPSRGGACRKHHKSSSSARISGGIGEAKRLASLAGMLLTILELISIAAILSRSGLP